MKLELGKSWQKNLESRIEGYRFEVGILNDGPHFLPVEHGLFQDPETKQFAGGPARKQTRTPGEKSIGEVFVSNMERLNIDLLRRPFEETSSEIMKFTKEFLKTAVAKGSIKRVENLLQAIVRNPIMREEYGTNSSQAADNKGFDRHLIDTAQMFKAIRAKVFRRV